MKTLQRHASTGQYFRSLGNWTPDRDDAYDFGLTARAMKFARKMGLPNLELILDFDQPQQISDTPFEVFWRKMLRAQHA